ncbi:MAG: hypothetical protein IJG56_01330, partial [Clostridia bacterium]|nr:hypothetical protein [Clostridia bacterium]
TQPWILDFDLQKLHSLESDIGMGTIEQFYAGSESSLKLLSEKFLDPRLEVSATDAGNAQENATPTTDGGNPADSEKGKSQTEAVPGASENAPSSSQDGNGESGTPGSSQENTPGGAPGNSQENAPVSTPENTGFPECFLNDRKKHCLFSFAPVRSEASPLQS